MGWDLLFVIFPENSLSWLLAEIAITESNV